MAQKGNAESVWCENLKERDHLEDISVDRKVLKCVLKKQNGTAFTGLIWLRIRTRGWLL
jgi:hypothetical protein